MALEKNIETKQGVTASFWRITSFRSNMDTDQVRIIVAGYKDKPAYENNKTHLEKQDFVVRGLHFDQYFEIGPLDQQGMNPIKAGYSYLVNETAIFKNAVHV